MSDTTTPTGADGLAELLAAAKLGFSHIDVVSHGNDWAKVRDAIDTAEKRLAALSSVADGPMVFRNVGDSEAQFIADGERLNCPACGGSGHVEDTRPAAPVGGDGENANSSTPAGAPTAQQPLDDAANNAGVATGSRNASPSESVTRGSLPALIEDAVNRFLGWPLPRDFSPDHGVSFTPPILPQHGWPSGTNLLSAMQAKAMFEHCLATRPAAAGAGEGWKDDWHLVGHPAYPSPLHILPGTRENVVEIMRRFGGCKTAYLVHRRVQQTDYKGAALEAFLAAAPSPGAGGEKYERCLACGRPSDEPCGGLDGTGLGCTNRPATRNQEQRRHG